MSQNDNPDERAAFEALTQLDRLGLGRDDVPMYEVARNAYEAHCIIRAALAARTQPIPPADPETVVTTKAAILAAIEEGVQRGYARALERTPETAEPPALTDAACVSCRGNGYLSRWDDVCAACCGTGLVLASTPPPEQASTPALPKSGGYVSLEQAFENAGKMKFEQASTPRAEPAERAALQEIHNWLVCWPIASADDMGQSFPHMTDLAGRALGYVPEGVSEAEWFGEERALPPSTAPDEATAVAALRPEDEREKFYETWEACVKETGHKPSHYDIWLMARGLMTTDGRVLGGNPAAVSVEGLGVDARGFDVHPAEPSGSSHGPAGRQSAGASPDRHMQLLSGLWRHGLPLTNRAGQSLQQFIESVEGHLARKAEAK